MDWACGVETLELREDGTYSYSIEYGAGGRATDSGSWKLVPKNERLRGAQVVLQNALDTWEYGRAVLLFNPDIQGFTRQ